MGYSYYAEYDVPVSSGGQQILAFFGAYMMVEARQNGQSPFEH